jgi:hypothetical protein
MEEDKGILAVIDSLEVVEHCSECGHAWMNDEPVHYADCRFFLLDEQPEEDDDISETSGWRSYRIALPCEISLPAAT